MLGLYNVFNVSVVLVVLELFGYDVLVVVLVLVSFCLLLYCL